MSERRQAAATAGVGAGLVGAGGVARHRAALRSFEGLAKDPKVHAFHMAKPGVKGRKLWLAGHGLGLIGAAPLAVGTVGLVRGQVAKRDKRPLWQEGLTGTATSLKGRTESLRTSQPRDVRATQVGTAVGSGALGGVAARVALRKRPLLKPVAGPIAGVLAGTASIPLANKVIHRRHPDYEVTPTGVKRKIAPVKRPGSKSFSARPMPRNLREDVGKIAPRIVHHGTTERAGRQILSEGFRESERGRHGPGVYVSDKATATRYARNRKPNVHGGGSRGDRHTVVTAMAVGPARATSDPSRLVYASDNLIPVGHARPDLATRLRQREPATLRRTAAVGGGSAAAGYGATQVRKDDYTGRQISYRAQRAAITGAGMAPVVGGIAQARVASRYAPPGQAKRAAVRQYAEGPLAGTAAGVAGAYGGAELAHRSARVARAVGGAERWKHDRVQDVRTAVGFDRKAHDPESATKAIRELAGNRKVLRPLGRSLPAAGGALLGYHALKNVAGTAGTQHAISVNQRRQDAYNRAHHLGKALDSVAKLGSAPTKKEAHSRARLKRTNAALATVGGLAGLGSLGLLAAGKKGPAVTTGIVGSGIGGTNALIGAQVQRREARAIDPVHKALAAWALRPVVGAQTRTLGAASRMAPGVGIVKDPSRKVRAVRAVRAAGSRMAEGVALAPEKLLQPGLEFAKGLPTHAVHPSFGKVRVLSQHSKDHFMVLTNRDEKRLLHRDTLTFTNRPGPVGKRAGVQITGTPDEHKRLISQYGDRGPLPSGLDRETKMKAYEARYVHAGGDKSEKWNHRANAAEGSRNLALAAGTAGLAGLAALKHPRAARRLAKHPRLSHRLDATALTAGAAGGASELYGEYARHKRASYANSPGGVARSALTRMRAYTPDSVDKAEIPLGIPRVPRAFRRPMPSALFHGTSHELKPGDVISPHNAIGGTDRGQGRAFATGDLRDAHSYARTRAGGAGGRVYRVEPVDHSDLKMENIGPRRRDGFTNVSSTAGFRVVGEAGAPRTAPAPFKPKPVSRFRPQASAGISLGG